MQHAPTHIEIKHIIAQLTAVFEDEQRYRQLLRCRDAQAQQLLDLFQNLLDNDTNWIDPTFWRNLVAAAQRLATSAERLPRCFNLGQVELLEDDPFASGSFGDIYKARFRDLPVCLKVGRVYFKSDIDTFSKTLAAEAILWAQLSHPNLLPFYGLYEFKRLPCLVSPWMENHDINQFLKHHPDANRLLLILDIARGVSYLHTNDVIHGDLKGANVLVDDAGRARIADFRLSSVLGAGILHWKTHSAVGPSPRWQAPELLDPKNDQVIHYSKPTDVYAFSSTSYEVLTGNFPFHEVYYDANVILEVQGGAQPSRPLDTSHCWSSWGLTEFIWSLMEACWNRNPQKRPSIHDIVMRLTSKTSVDDEFLISAPHFRHMFEGGSYVFSADSLKALLDENMPLRKNTATDSNPSGHNEAQLLDESNEKSTKTTNGIRVHDLTSDLLEGSPDQRHELEKSTFTQAPEVLVVEPTPSTTELRDLPARTKPTTEDQEASAPKSESDGEGKETSIAHMSEEQVNMKIAEDLIEFFAVRKVDEAESYFVDLSPVHHPRIVDKFTCRAIESKEADAELVARLFSFAVTKGICSADAFEDGFTPLAETIDGIAIDAPKALLFFATIVKSARLEEERRRRLASRSLDNEQLLSLIL